MRSTKYKNYDDIPLIFSPPELAEILGISKNKAYALVYLPDFPKVKLGKRIVINKNQFLAWFEKKQNAN